MEKEVIKSLLFEYQQYVVGIDFIHRDYDIDDALNYVFVGIRRAGKSYLMYQQIAKLVSDGHKPEEILYFNFEDERLDGCSLSDLDLIKTCYEEMYDHKPIFFLDEIQIIPNWEKFVRRIADQGYRIYVTGSNAQMLSSEIATTLGGRFLIKYVYPYSFSEFLTTNGIDLKMKNLIPAKGKEIVKLHESYFYFGGLPEIYFIKDKRAWLSNLYQKIFFGDLITRYQIRNDFALKIMIRKLAENVKQPTSFNRLANVVSSSGKKISTDTVIDYLEYLKETWIVFSLENIVSKMVDKVSIKKYYFIDNGLLNLFLMDPKTSLLENQVAISLYRLYPNELFFYNKGIEVDFYLFEKQIAIQVCYSLNNAETYKREVTALLKLKSQVEVKKMLIITKEEEKLITIDDQEIKVVPSWKFLLFTQQYLSEE